MFSILLPINNKLSGFASQKKQHSNGEMDMRGKIPVKLYKEIGLIKFHKVLGESHKKEDKGLL